MKSTRKTITTLLSVYLLILMVMPCSDAHAQFGKVNQTQVSQLDNDHHHDVELCTPFCVCAGCTAAIVLQPSIEFETFQFDFQFKEAVSSYKFIASSFFGSIWQPPQLV